MGNRNHGIVPERVGDDLPESVNDHGLPVGAIDPNTVPADLHPLVYFIGNDLRRGAAVKIGTTADLRQRFSKLRLSSPVPLFVHAVARDDRHREAEFHHEFRKYRLHGEWFRITPTLLERIRAFQMIHTVNLASLSRLNKEQAA